MENTVLITIISSLLDGLASAVLAGVVIWFWQIKYSERKSKSNILFDRKCIEEDLFYDQFRNVKYGLQELFILLTNNGNNINTQERIDTIVSNLQKCSNQIKVSHIPLEKYESCLENLFFKYDELSTLWRTGCKKLDSLSKKEIYEIDKKLQKLKDEILDEINNIDKIYFTKKV